MALDMEGRILFVDDEPSVLDSLRRSLRPYRSRWEMTFAQGGEKALEALDQGTFDLVCSDMRMPGMDGAALLARVQNRWPETFRFILSGQAEQEAMLRSVPFVHRFLSKPCDTGVLAGEIERVMGLRRLFTRPGLREAVCGSGMPPVLPRVLLELSALLARPDVHVRTVVQEVYRDLGLCAKVLQLVNSSYYGLARRVLDIEDAVKLLGNMTLRSIVLSLSVHSNFSGKTRQAEAVSEALQLHSVKAGILARQIVPPSLAEEAFFAGLFHDLGHLILAANDPERFASLRMRGVDGKSVESAEKDLWGFTHGEVGGYMLALWGVSAPIVEAVIHHHQPSHTTQRNFGVLGGVHVADCFAHEAEPEPGFPPGTACPLDHVFLQAVGQENRMSEWREAAALLVDLGEAQRHE